MHFLHMVRPWALSLPALLEDALRTVNHLQMLASVWCPCPSPPQPREEGDLLVLRNLEPGGLEWGVALTGQKQEQEACSIIFILRWTELRDGHI